MATQKHIRLRRRVLNRCLRSRAVLYTKYDLLDCVNRELVAEFGEDAKISIRTIEYELNEIETKADFVPDLRVGHQRVYRYENPNFNYRGDDETLDDEELETLDRAIDVLREADYGNKPLFAFLRTYLELIKTENADTSTISFQNNNYLHGLEHFEILMSATISKRTLNIRYQPYGKDERKLLFSPHQLKQYNDRWFLIGREKDNESVTNLAIDRINSVQYAKSKFQPPIVNYDDYFDEVVGVSVPKDKELERIKLRVSAERYPYLKSKVIDGSQREVPEESTDEATVIIMDLKINRELISILLSFGEDIEVLAPDTLRDIMRKKIELMMKKY